MSAAIFSRVQYGLIFFCFAIVYITGLFVPLMDNDSAHHANIALRMYLTGDYVNLVDHGKDYLDKPHLHFWLAAWSYEIFGVTSFAYKFPSFLFTLLGTWSVYRLGKLLYNAETGRLAALIITSAFAYILANNDVRMDAILTASIAFATWQLAAWLQHKKIVNAAGAALGLALGFCTKGHIAVFIPGVSILFFLAYRNKWKSLVHWQLLVIIVFFFFFISPVLYCYYLQFDLHPEKVIRGKSGRSGIAFILWNQNFERFQGDSFGADAKNDYLFFFHSFLWAFAPWSVLAFVAFFRRMKVFFRRRVEWLTTGTFFIMILLMTFSGFKLPHYLNIIFPVTAIFTSAFILWSWQRRKGLNTLLIIQLVMCVLLLAAVGVLSTWAFPVESWLVITGFFLLLFISVFLIMQLRNEIQRIVGYSAVASMLVFYLLNTNFYPRLLTYQGGNQLAFKTKGKVDPQQVYFWPGIYSSSFNFYTSELRKEFHDSVLNTQKQVWVLTDAAHLPQLREKGMDVIEKLEHVDYEVSQLQLPFINPGTRDSVTGTMILARVK